MKLMRLAICVATFAVIGGFAIAEDMDVRALQAKLAAQEARLNDLQAKMYSTGCEEGTVADGITTLRKNATITLGGTVNTRYFYRSGSIKNLQGGKFVTTHKAKGGDLFIADAKLEGKIDVNDNFDAYFKFNLQGDDGRHYGNAEQYWIRWKNICNSGFGVLVGRDDLKYGMGPSVGVLDSWSGTDNTNTYNDMFGHFEPGNPILHDPNSHYNPIPTHTAWDYSAVNQITPYWENCDGSFKAELSFFQSLEEDNNAWLGSNGGSNGPTFKYRKSQNDGIGSMSGRITWQPIEGLTLVASAINKHDKYAKNTFAAGAPGWISGNGKAGAKNNFAASLGVEYTPSFLCDRLTTWAYYQHGWNEGWIDDVDSDLVNAGFKINFTDQFYGFAQGDYLYIKDKHNKGANATNINPFYSATGYAGYLGLGYILPYGANFEVGYRHEKMDYKFDVAGNGKAIKVKKYKADVIYAHLGFNF